MTEEEKRKSAFKFFNEVGIINQLATAAFNRRLPDGLHVSHFAVLNHLTRLGDGKTPLFLAGAFQVAKGTMTHTLSELSQRGFVEMRPHASDGRSKLVHLTDAGRAFHRDAIESLAPLFGMLESRMDMEKLNAALPVLQEVRAVLDNNRDI